MKLAVTDSNIFIDLLYTNFIEHLFSIECDIHTCIEVIDELKDPQQKVLRGFQRQGLLTIHNLTAEQHREIRALQFPRALSFTDAAVVFLADKLKASILTGDGLLKKHCLKLQFDVHGILWLFECFHDRALVTTEDSIATLETLMAYNDRLPKAACDALFEKWKSLL